MWREKMVRDAKVERKGVKMKTDMNMKSAFIYIIQRKIIDTTKSYCNTEYLLISGAPGVTFRLCDWCHYSSVSVCVTSYILYKSFS